MSAEGTGERIDAVGLDAVPEPAVTAGPAGPDDVPMLSVVVACLNAAGTIAEQLDALAGQPCPVPWELLICDNGSQDDTAVIVARYADRLPLRVVDAAARRGPGAARNMGAAQARGGWLAFCDADDVVGRTWLVRMVESLREHPFVAGRFEGVLLNSARTRRSRVLDQQDGLQNAATRSGMPHAGAGNMGIHAEVFAQVGGFDEAVRCLEDTDLSWRVQALGVPLVYVPDLVVHVRLRSSLPSMYRQAFGYGRAFAQLERRYPSALHHGDRAASDPDVVRSRVRQALDTYRVWVGARPSLGHLIWQYGWHRGHRHETAAGRAPMTVGDRPSGAS